MGRIFPYMGWRKARATDGYRPLVERQSLDDKRDEEVNTVAAAPFSWLQYSIFALLGVSQLWVWHTFIVAAPYFQHRFATNPWIRSIFQSAIISTWTPTNLLVNLFVTRTPHSSRHRYQLYIFAGLATSAAVSVLLAGSTRWDTSPQTYLAVLLGAVALAALGSGLMQNGAHAFATGCERAEYTRAMLAGQAVAGVLPPVAEMASATLMGDDGEEGPGDAALAYFVTAAVVSAAAFAAFAFLTCSRRRRPGAGKEKEVVEAAGSASVGPWAYFARKLPCLTAAQFVCFAITITFPVLTAKVQSVHAPAESSVYRPATFIPLAFFVFTVGDLLGRLATAMPVFAFRAKGHPKLLLGMALARLVFPALYLLCNVNGRGALVPSDLFYFICVQLPFGVSHGWLATTCWMVVGDWVDDHEKGPAGSFMQLIVVFGLAAGSLLSFLLSGL